MSNFTKLTKHPQTGKWEEAQWIDNYYGAHKYGVIFPDNSIFNVDEIDMETEQPQQPKAAPTPTNTIDNILDTFKEETEDLWDQFMEGDDPDPQKYDDFLANAYKSAIAAINKTIMEAEARARIEGAYEQLVSLRVDVLQVNPDHTKASTLMVLDQNIRQLESKLTEDFWEAQLFPTKKYGRADNE